MPVINNVKTIIIGIFNLLKSLKVSLKEEFKEKVEI